jgi:hypothetical protein
MSVANLNSAGTLRCGKLVLAGQTIVPGAITTTVLTGQSGAGASGAVAVSTNITNTSAATALTFASTASTLELTGNISSAGGGGGTTVPTLWNASSAYAVGDVVSVSSLATPTGTFICIGAVAAGTNPAPSATPTKWTPVAPLAGGSGVVSLAGGGATPTVATGAVVFTSTVASGASTALTWTSSATGMELGGTIASGSQTVPYIVAAGQKSWATAGTTDAITFSPALPTGTFVIFLSWGMATAPPALLSCPPPTTGATTAAVVAGGSITAGSVYQYQVVRLTT